MLTWVGQIHAYNTSGFHAVFFFEYQPGTRVSAKATSGEQGLPHCMTAHWLAQNVFKTTM